MYQSNKDIAEFFIVYLAEAHAADSKRPVPYAEKFKINKHTTFGERCIVAERLVKEKKLTIPCLIDNMDDGVAAAYKARPDRVFIVGVDGKLVLAGHRGPFGFRPGVEAAEEWLASFREEMEKPITLRPSADPVLAAEAG